MVMNYEIIDTYLHMSNHYKLINSAKSVVNTSAPKTYQYLKNKKQNTSSSPSTRYSTPTLLISKNDRLPSRANSHYEFGRRNIKIHNCLQNNATVTRSGSAPSSQKYSRKISAPWNTNFLKNKPTKSKTMNNNSSGSGRISRESSSCSKPEVKHVSTTKTPIPTPRKKLTINKSVIPNYEYLQFSLRITEDIIRNDLYNPEEMHRVFNSHLEANKGRLDMTKMLQQIDHLCKQLSITTINTDSDNKSTELTLRNNSKILLDKIANRQYEISTEEIRNLSGIDLQNIITGILDYDKKETATLKELPINVQSTNEDFIDLSEKNIEPLKDKINTTSDESTKYFDIVTQNVDENVCTDLVPVYETEKQSTNKKDVTIINLEVNQLHNDLLEINKNITEGFHHLKETIVTENPVKDVEIIPSTSNDKIKSEVSIKKNEITQTPFSKEIAIFFDKLPEHSKKTEDTKQKQKIAATKDVLHFIDITEKVEIKNTTQTYEQINIYEPINIFESETSSTEEQDDNFISTVNHLILDGMNDLFDPVPRKDIVPNIFTGDYYKYETKINDEDKYKVRHNNVKSVSSKTSTEISLSEGEIIQANKSNRNILKILEKYEYKTYEHNPGINKYQLHYDCRNLQFIRSSSSTPITSSKSSRIISPIKKQESLLSDGEIKYSSSDSDDCKTDYSNNSFKLI